MKLMERVKEECNKHSNGCSGCLLHSKKGCLCADDTPNDWDIEAIRKALGEEADYDKALENINKKMKEEIVVPYMITAEVIKHDPYITADVINEIINCLEQIKERLK